MAQHQTIPTSHDFDQLLARLREQHQLAMDERCSIMAAKSAIVASTHRQVAAIDEQVRASRLQLRRSVRVLQDSAISSHCFWPNPR